VLKRAGSVDDKNAVLAAIKATNLNTIAGPVSWGKGPVGNVTKTPLVGGQWGRGKGVPFDMTIVTNRSAPSIPTGGTLRALKQA
jgi:branched-chain amino acid transport system substrate-binding protein